MTETLSEADAMAPARPQVSIVIPAYNRADTIEMAVRSVLDQTIRDIEVIVVDDASRDATCAVVEDMNDPRIRLIRLPENSGACAARNAGIKAARAPLIAFQDSDDQWLPDKLRQQIAALESRPDAIAVYCAMRIQPQDGIAGADARQIPGSEVKQRSGDIMASLIHSSFVSTQTLMIRASIMDRHTGFDERLRALQDWDFVLRLAQLGSIAFVDEPLVIQYFSPDSITKSPRNRVLSREYIVNKYADTLFADRKVLAYHHYVLAGGFRQIGEPRKSLSYLVSTIRSHPFHLKAWLRLLPTALACLVGQAGGRNAD